MTPAMEEFVFSPDVSIDDVPALSAWIDVNAPWCEHFHSAGLEGAHRDPARFRRAANWNPDPRNPRPTKQKTA